MGQAHTITFWVDEDGFHYRDQGNKDAKSKHVKKADSVEWRSRANKDFVIQFDKWPFEGAAEEIEGKGGQTKPRAVAITPEPGQPAIRCKYTVKLTSGLSDDPEIIIDPEGGN